MTAARMRIVTRVGGTRAPLPRFVLMSILLHVGFVAGALMLPNLRPKKTFPVDPSIQAVLLPAPRRPVAPPTPPASTAPVTAPEPEPEPKDLKAATEDPPEPVPDPNPPPKPKPVAKKIDKPKPAPRQSPPSRPSPITDPPAAAGSEGPVGNPEGGDALAGMGSEFNWYRDAVARALYSSWRQPMLNASDPVEVAVAFEIVKSGAVRGVRLERESGIPAVDRSVLRAVHEATLPPLPRNYRQGVQPALFVFRLYPE